MNLPEFYDKINLIGITDFAKGNKGGKSMIFCQNCGAQMKDGSRFCQKCGAPVKIQPSAPGGGQPQGNRNMGPGQPGYGPNQGHGPNSGYGSNQAYPPNYGPNQGYGPGGRGPKKLKNSPLYIGIGAAVGIVVVVALVLLLGGKKFKPSYDDYFNVTYSGYTGDGSAYAELNLTALISDYGKAVLNKNVDVYTRYPNIWQNMGNCITYSLDKETGLSNGDEIKLTVNIDKDLASQYKLKMTTGEKTYTYTVSGLSEYEELDAFKDVELAYSGYAPAASAYIKNNSNNDYLEYLDYTLSKSEEISNGDTITVTVSDDDVDYLKRNGYILKEVSRDFTAENVPECTSVDPFENVSIEFSGYAPVASASIRNNNTDDVLGNMYMYLDKSDNINVGDVLTVTIDEDSVDYAEDCGYLFTQTSKGYTAENLGKYLTSYDELSETTLTNMNNESKDILEAYFAQNVDAFTLVDSLEIMGGYCRVPKNYDYDYENTMFLVYRGHVSAIAGDFTNAEAFFIIKFTNCIQNADGSQFFDNDVCLVDGDYNLSTGWTDVQAYTSGPMMYNDFVAQYKDSYYCSISEGLKQFGE